MFKGLSSLGMVLVAGLLPLAGCSHDYGDDRPPVDQLDSRDKGLQSKDLVTATDQLGADLLAAPELNGSKTQWTMVVMNMGNLTTERWFNQDIFIQRLRMNLARNGKGRVQLIENRDRFHNMQNKELEGPARNDFGEGAGGGGHAAGIQPDYALYGEVSEMPNRGTSYYLITFSVTNLNDRRTVWTNSYEVRVAR